MAVAGGHGDPRPGGSGNAAHARRRAGWLPRDQDGLETWLAENRQGVEDPGGQDAPYPAVGEFPELIDANPVVRVYRARMIEQVPATRPYRRIVDRGRSCRPAR